MTSNSDIHKDVSKGAYLHSIFPIDYESKFTRIRSYIALALQKKSAFLLGAQQTLIPSLIQSQLPNAVRWSLFSTLEVEIGQENLISGCRRVSLPLWDVLDPEGMWVPVLGKECGSWSEFDRMISQLDRWCHLGLCCTQDHCWVHWRGFFMKEKMYITKESTCACNSHFAIHWGKWTVLDDDPDLD